MQEEFTDPLIDRLKQFTPQSSGVDTAAIVFAAGKASVRPNSFWKWTTVLLLCSQSVTLGLWWKMPAQPTSNSTPTSDTIEVIPARSEWKNSNGKF